MRPPLLSVLVLTLLFTTPAVPSDELRALHDCLPGAPIVPDGSLDPQSRGFDTAYLLKAAGDLDVFLPSSSSTYTAYFHVPIVHDGQAPVLIDVQSPHLIDYRFIELTAPNLLVAARLHRAPSTTIHWEAWVLATDSSWAGLPLSAPIPDPEDLPGEVRPWLEPSDCVQSDDPFIRDEAAEVRADTTRLQELAERIADYCTEIAYGFDHFPIAFDAFYAMNWGSSCTGRAHAGAALFRANGVPARTLHVMPIWAYGRYDMHWIIEYFVPGFGWARLETSLGQNLVDHHTEIVTFVAGIEDEFPLFYPSAISGHWHTSDPDLGMYNPDWGRAHYSHASRELIATDAEVRQALDLTTAVANRRARVWGLALEPKDQLFLDRAHASHLLALDAIRTQTLTAYVEQMTETLALYDAVRPGAIATLFYDDFEALGTSWAHGGDEDEWELGVPTIGPAGAHSGTRCWGTDLDDTYENNADSWLLSPPVDLRDLASAYLSVHIYNEVEDRNQGYVYDPLWVDVTTDGRNFTPLCSEMGGVNDDPEVPAYGGWSRLVLDLTPYVDQEHVQIRFRFQSDAALVQPGSYIDDVHVYGRSRVYHRPRVEDPEDRFPAAAP